MSIATPRTLRTDSADTAYERVARSSHEQAARLAQQLMRETQGDVLFSLADRGRYSTDASIYQQTNKRRHYKQHHLQLRRRRRHWK